MIRLPSDGDRPNTFTPGINLRSRSPHVNPIAVQSHSHFTEQRPSRPRTAWRSFKSCKLINHYTGAVHIPMMIIHFSAGRPAEHGRTEAGRKQRNAAVNFRFYRVWRSICTYTCVERGHPAAWTNFGLADRITICLPNLWSVLTPVFSCGRVLSDSSLIQRTHFNARCEGDPCVHIKTLDLLHLVLIVNLMAFCDSAAYQKQQVTRVLFFSCLEKQVC